MVEGFNKQKATLILQSIHLSFIQLNITILQSPIYRQELKSNKRRRILKIIEGLSEWCSIWRENRF